MRTRSLSLLIGVFFATSCAVPPTSPADDFWRNLRALCGNAYEGKVIEGTAANDAAFKESRLVMHVRKCTDAEIWIALHVGENRSRTWVITRTPTGLRLKHDHRHEGGSEDKVTQYGGDHAAPGTATRQEFPADAFTAELLPAAKTNIWTMEIVPNRSFAYALRRDAEGRRFRIEFDLTTPVAAPPPPWGAE